MRTGCEAKYTHHVERVGDQRQRMHCVARDEFDKEECRVDSQQYHDARGFGEPHVGGIGAPVTLCLWAWVLTAQKVRSGLRGLFYGGRDGERKVVLLEIGKGLVGSRFASCEWR
jgi:hypothetical protein